MTEDNGDQTTAKFLRGLTIGAIVGAVIAGSSLWGRWWTTRGRRAPHHGPGGTPDPAPGLEPDTTAPRSETPTT